MATANRGWCGVKRELLHYLRIVGADQDEEGRFILSGDVVTFLGMDGDNAETVVGPDACYYVDGQPGGLASGLGSTSYGSRPFVII